MTTRLPHPIRDAAAGILLVAGLNGLARAQGRPADRGRDADTTRAAVTVALVEELPVANARAVVERHSGRGGNIIFLREGDATPGALTAALAALAQDRIDRGDDVERDVRIAISNFATSALAPELRQRLEQHLGRLRAAEARAVDGIGNARTIVVSLPSLERLRALRRQQQ